MKVGKLCYVWFHLIGIVLLNHNSLMHVNGRGLLLLYRPQDITVECASSAKLRFDLSFGMGMSDTITVVLRTLPDVDYECQIDITTDSYNKIIVVIRFPTSIGFNCEHNPSAFQVMKMNDCFPICSDNHLMHQDIHSNYWLLYTQGRFRFLFRSNSSVNSDINAYLYEITVTTARLRKNHESCHRVNETECYSPKNDEYYCMTSGIVCDGIKNCGADDWYDEKKSDCELPEQTLGYTPVIAVLAIIFCAFLAGIHMIQRCLPSATSFFVFNTNEDNKLRLDPLLRPDIEGFTFTEAAKRKQSLVPIYLTDSSDEESNEDEESEQIELDLVDTSLTDTKRDLMKMASVLSETKKTVSERIQQRLRSVVGRVRLPTNRTSNPLTYWQT